LFAFFKACCSIDDEAKNPFPLFSIIEECLKIYYGHKENAYERAVTEEKQCYARSKSRLGELKSNRFIG
jgi:ElonginA binding-protein 1